VNPNLARVHLIKERYERDLLALDGVEGVGIGEDGGEPLIKVYVSEDSLRPLTAIPSHLEDVPVVVEESGIFEAY
jgi:hypothetical protein